MAARCHLPVDLDEKTMMIARFFWFFLWLIAAYAPAAAQFPGAALNVPATLEAETRNPAPGGIVTLAFVMRPKPGWHGYWQNGGDAGVGMQLDWNLPAGVSAGELRYPVPGRLIIAGLMNYVYERPYTLLVDLKIDASVAPGTALPVRVRGDWLACTDEICVPEGNDLAVNLVAGGGVVDAGARARFDGYRAALPVPIDQKGRYQIDGTSIRLAIPFPAAASVDRPYFYAATEKLLAYAKPQAAWRRGDMLIITASADEFSLPDFNGGAVRGLIEYSDGRGILVTAQMGAVPPAGAAQGDKLIFRSDEPGGAQEREQGRAQGAAAGTGPLGFLGILALALLGGLILNLMPCVFPILGLKALSLAKMGGDEAAAKRDAIAYSAGIILVCIALGAIMLMLRAAGEQVGWAFQLQEPRIVLLLLLLMAAVTINLWGGFELGSIGVGGDLVQKKGVAGAFWTGALAALVATPCTGPFMAVALGAALLLPAIPALTLFAGLGLGLALPYLAIAFIPALRRLMPKPGPWLEKFRRFMGIPMALTAAALLWLLWRLSGQTGLLIGMAAALILTGLLLAYGRLQHRRSGMPVLFAMATAGLALLAVVTLPRDPVAPATQSSGILASEAYSEDLLARYRRAGYPVFVYFTADWCVTCKVNEAAALDREDTAKAFEQGGVKILTGDFTRADPAIARVLTQYGRPGVPLYLYFAPGKQAEILPQILTAEMVQNLARK